MAKGKEVAIKQKSKRVEQQREEDDEEEQVKNTIVAKKKNLVKNLPVVEQQNKKKRNQREIEEEEEEEEEEEVDDDEEEEDEDEHDEEEGEDDDEQGEDDNDNNEEEEQNFDDDEEEEDEEQRKIVTKKKAKKITDRINQTGVVYLSRIPPHMQPLKVKHLFSKYGEVGRVYLTPEDESARKRRIKRGGNKKVNFKDGWVEFLDKKVAKRVAISLNATPIGGKNTSFFSSDLWCIKYLSKFKWHHLTEKIAFDNEMKRQQMLQEMSQAKREKDFYMDKVDAAKRAKAIEKKRLGKGKVLPQVEPKQAFSQRQKLNVEQSGVAPSSNLLSKLFSSGKATIDTSASKAKKARTE